MNTRKQARDKKRGWAFIFAILASCAMAMLALCAFPSRALAQNGPDLETPCTLTVQDGNAGVHYNLYNVGDVTGSGDLAWSEDMIALFETAGAEVPSLAKDQDASVWRDAAKIALSALSGTDMAVVVEGSTDTAGTLTFDGIKPGLYLLTADDWSNNEFNFKYAPTLVALPAWDAGACEWKGDIVVEPKFSMIAAEQPEELGDDDPSSWGDVANALAEFVKTGDVRYPVALIAVVGLLAGITAWRLRQKGE